MDINYEELAHEFCKAIKNLSENEDSLDNLESYLSMFFDVWMEKWASTPEGLTSELKHFSRMFDNNQTTTYHSP